MIARSSRPGFTRVEALVVVALLFAGAAMFAPAVQGARAASGQTTCADNLRRMGIAIHQCASANDAVTAAESAR